MQRLRATPVPIESKTAIDETSLFNKIDQYLATKNKKLLFNIQIQLKALDKSKVIDSIVPHKFIVALAKSGPLAPTLFKTFTSYLSPETAKNIFFYRYIGTLLSKNLSSEMFKDYLNFIILLSDNGPLKKTKRILIDPRIRLAIACHPDKNELWNFYRNILQKAFVLGALSKGNIDSQEIKFIERQQRPINMVANNVATTRSDTSVPTGLPAFSLFSKMPWDNTETKIEDQKPLEYKTYYLI